MSDRPAPAAPIRSYDLLAERSAASSGEPSVGSTLQMLNERFCRLFRSALVQHLRRATEITCAGVERLKHREVLQRLSAPCDLSVVALRPLSASAIVAIDAALVATIVESRFGGDGRFPLAVASREFTPFERKLVRRVVETTLTQLAAAWDPLGPIEPQIVRRESNPQFAAFAAPEEEVCVSLFDVTVDRGGGQLIIGIPCAALGAPQPATAVDGGPAAVRDPGRLDALRTGLGRAILTLTAELGRIDISVAELMELRAGNVFEMTRPDSVTVQAGGVPLFRGRWGRHGGKIAVRVDERLPGVDAAPPPAEGGRILHREP